MPVKIIRIEKLILKLDEKESVLEWKVPAILELPKKEILGFSIVKKSIDARNKNDILFVYSLDVEISNDVKKYSILDKNWNLKTDYSTKKNNIKIIKPYEFSVNKIKNKCENPPVIVWSGPAWLFAWLLLAKAWLNPIIIERWQDVDTRIDDVEDFLKNWKLKENSNIQFGEWWAWTFSDWKLYTLINDPKSKFIFEAFVNAWAPKEIIYSARPHIWTDRLRLVVKNLRKKIIELWWDVRFNSCLTDLKIKNSKIVWVEINWWNKNIPIELISNDLILAIWHSARDTYKMLYKNKLEFQQKPFAMWVRVEHSADIINKSQFWSSCSHAKLPTASYKLVNHDKNNRSVYTFCMCPGWYVVAASSEKWRLTVNGMSEYNQDSWMSNSALLVWINTSDYGSTHPLAWIEFQRKREEKAFVAGGSNYHAPAQFVWDFLERKDSLNSKNKQMISTYRPGIKLTNLDKCLPGYVSDAIRSALPKFDRKISWFADSEALLIWIEARSSAVVRIVRSSHTLESNIAWIYPTGEWAWYAGWITSAAIDWLNVAEKIIEKYS